jgi:hypothetical protein
MRKDEECKEEQRSHKTKREAQKKADEPYMLKDIFTIKFFQKISSLYSKQSPEEKRL